MNLSVKSDDIVQDQDGHVVLKYLEFPDWILSHPAPLSDPSNTFWSLESFNRTRHFVMLPFWKGARMWFNSLFSG